MKVTYKATRRLTVEFEAGTQKEIWEQVAALDETFGVSECGKCGSDHIVTVYRSNKKGHHFPELHCKNAGCYYRLAFGQNLQGGTIFPRRRYHDKHPLVKAGKVKDGDWIPNNGWEKPFKASEEDGE